MQNSKFFINPDLAAPNVKTVWLDPQSLVPAKAAVPALQAGWKEPGATELKNCTERVKLNSASPQGWDSDIVWLSAADPQSFLFFEQIFHATKLSEHVKQHVDHDKAIVLYSGFFVMRQSCQSEEFHTDWKDGRNDAFTAIIPLSPDVIEMGLRYLDIRGNPRSYAYKESEAILFGEKFLHCTQPGKSREPVVLLSFTFGTDRMDRWEQISRNAANQGRLHRRPDGKFVRDGKIIDQT